MAKGVEDEAKFLPYGHSYLMRCKDFEGPQTAAQGLVRASKKAADPKAKAKGGAKRKGKNAAPEQ